MSKESSKFKQIYNPSSIAIVVLSFSFLIIALVILFFITRYSHDVSDIEFLNKFLLVIVAGTFLIISMFISFIGMLTVFMAWLKGKNKKISQYLFLTNLILFLSPGSLWYAKLYLAEQSEIDTAEAYYQSLSLDQKLAYSLKGGKPPSYTSDVDHISLLIKEGADINALNNYGRSPLCDSSLEQGNIDTMKLILDRGAAVNHRCANGETALHFVARECNEKKMEVLGMYNADFTLVSDDHKNSFHLLLEEFYRDEASCVETVLIMKKFGVDINMSDRNGNTILHIIAPRGKLSLLQVLIEAGVDTKIKNSKGQTALDLARQSFEKNTALKYQEAFDYLVENENKI